MLYAHHSSSPSCNLSWHVSQTALSCQAGGSLPNSYVRWWTTVAVADRHASQRWRERHITKSRISFHSGDDCSHSAYSARRCLRERQSVSVLLSASSSRCALI